MIRLFKTKALLPLFATIILAAILFPVFARARENARRTSCQSNLQKIGLAIAMYRADYNERYPVDRDPKTGRGWTETLMPYTRSVTLYHCPSTPDGPVVGDYNGAARTDYFFNRRLSKYAEVRSPESEDRGNYVIVLGDGERGLTASMPDYSIAALPPAWTTGDDVPARRHLGGANYLFIDGHVKWVRDTDTIGTAPPAARLYTFAPR